MWLLLLCKDKNYRSDETARKRLNRLQRFIHRNNGCNCVCVESNIETLYTAIVSTLTHRFLAISQNEYEQPSNAEGSILSSDGDDNDDDDDDDTIPLILWWSWLTKRKNAHSSLQWKLNRWHWWAEMKMIEFESKHINYGFGCHAIDRKKNNNVLLCSKRVENKHPD